MNRFITYWNHYTDGFEPELLTLLLANTSIQSYAKAETVVSPVSPNRWSYFVLEGALKVDKVLENGSVQMIDFVLPGEVFSGTKHPHSSTPTPWSYTTVKPCDLLQIKNPTLIQLARNYDTINDILHILKQRMIALQTHRIELLMLDDRYARFKYLREELDSYVHHFPSQTLADYLGISRSMYFIYQKRWLAKQR